MKRVSIYVAALIGFGGMLALTSATQAQGPGAPTPVPQPAPQGTRPTIAVFNMAAVMKDYTKAKYQVYLLNEERKKLSADVVAMKGEYVKLQQESQLVREPAVKENMTKRQVELARQIEDRSRDIDKQLNDKATAVISTLYDEIKSVVDRTAEMNGYLIVFAYPDATGPEATSAYVKELRLKPPAAQPFYVSKQVDITGVVVQALNAWYPSPQPPPQAPTPSPGPNSPPAAPPAPGMGAAPGQVRP